MSWIDKEKEYKEIAKKHIASMGIHKGKKVGEFHLAEKNESKAQEKKEHMAKKMDISKRNYGEKAEHQKHGKHEAFGVGNKVIIKK